MTPAAGEVTPGRPRARAVLSFPARFLSLMALVAPVAPVALIALTACRPDPSPPPGGRRLVVLGVDGAGWEELSPLLEQGRLPNLARLFRAGAAGRLVSADPPLPAPLYTSLATGRPRAEHGILGEALRSPDGYGLRPITADRRRAPPVWSIAVSRGLRVGVSGWPATFPVDRIDGYMLSDMFDPVAAAGPGFIHPAAAFGQGEDPAASVTLPESIEPVAALDPGLRRRFEADLRSLERGLALFRVYQPRLALFRLESVDYASHRFWQFHQPRYLDLARSRGDSVDPDRAAALAGAVEGSYRFVDECVGLLLERLPIDATLIIVSPFSFRGVGMTDYLHVDADRLLASLGYLSRNHDGTIDWSATTAFAPGWAAGPSLGVSINRRGREAEGTVGPARAGPVVREVAAALEALHTADGDPLFRSVDISGNPSDQTPDIRLVENLELNPMASVRVGSRESRARDLFRRSSEDFSIHQAEGILLAAGEGIRQGASGLEVSQLDLLPTMLRLLGLPSSRSLPGRVVEGMISDPTASTAEAETESYGDAPASPEPMFLPEDLSEAWLEKLRESGHIPSHRR